MAAVGVLACGEENTTGPDIDPPGAPSAVSAVASATTVTVTFTEGSDSDSSRVIVTTTGETDRTALLATGTTTTDFTGLTEGVTYAVQVFAINDAGETASAIVQVDIPEDVVLVTADIVTNTTWTRDKTWILGGPIFVGDDVNDIDVTLTIEPGTTILGDVDPPQGARGSYLIISRGSRIIADANASLANKSVRPNPDSVIVFTSSAPRGQRQRGDWGGLVINGAAPINSGTEAEGEGESGLFGGTDVNDDSGILRGVRVEFAGDRVTATDELNGIALQGVGAGTTIDYVQVHYNVDDGTEPFGGTVSQTHMVVTGIGDDSFDGTDGYRGFMQFVIAQQRADDADNGFEISNNGDDPGNASPKSTAIIANATMIGARLDLGSGEISALGSKSDNAVSFREGSNYRVFNVIATGFGKSGFCIEDAETAIEAEAGRLRFENNILWDNVTAGDSAANYGGSGCDGAWDTAEHETFFDAGNNLVADPQFDDAAFNVGSMMSPPNLIPTMPAGYTAFDASTLNNDANITMPVDGRTLVATTYAGAVDPSVALADQWYYGWTVWAADGSDSRPNDNGN
jgi:hypothetical protein